MAVYPSFLRRLLALAVLLPALGACRPVPEPPDDEWPSASPASQGLRGEVLSRYSDAAAAGTYGAIHCLLVARHGFLVHESYFAGRDRGQLEHVYSVTKTVTALLAGMALERGWIRGLDDKLLSFFPEYLPPARMDERKAAVDLEDLLAMRAGFRWDESSAPVDSPLNSLFGLYRAADWYRFLLDLPMERHPGTAFTYNSGCSVLLGGVLARAAGSPARELAAARLFAPLGIREFVWDDGSPGECNTGWGLWLRPRDMAKIGQLLLRGGDWQGQAIVSDSWVREMFACRSPLADGFGYGYQVWLMPLRPGSPPGSYGIKVAWGYGGQFIFVVPELDMVAVSTAANFLDDGGAIDFIQALLAEAVAD